MTVSAEQDIIEYIDGHPCCQNYEGAPDGRKMVDAHAAELAIRFEHAAIEVHDRVVYAIWQLIEAPREDGISPHELAQLMNECMAGRPDDLWEGQ